MDTGCLTLQHYALDAHISNNIDAFSVCVVYLSHWPYTILAQWYPAKNQYSWSIRRE